MTADDLPAAFASLPGVWRERLLGWTPQAQQRVVDGVKAASGTKAIGPPDPFRALRLVAPDDVKVIVIGQDPYPTPGHADGLAFSAGKGRPRSLARIFEVLAQDREGWTPPEVWRLDAWARQGVLLLNPTLTVELSRSGSHLNAGWLALTSKLVQMLCQGTASPIIFAWGGKAQKFLGGALPDGLSPQVFMTRHPSYDFYRQFMAEGSHFRATEKLVDWWAL